MLLPLSANHLMFIYPKQSHGIEPYRSKLLPATLDSSNTRHRSELYTRSNTPGDYFWTMLWERRRNEAGGLSHSCLSAQTLILLDEKTISERVEQNEIHCR